MESGIEGFIGMNERNSFILYTDIIEVVSALSTEQKGILFQAILDYQTSGVATIDDDIVKIAFIPIRQRLDANNAKWQDKAESRKEAGRRGGLAKGSKNDFAKNEIAKDSKTDFAKNEIANPSKNNFAKNDDEKNSKTNFATKKIANEAVNVNVNDNVNVNVNGNVSDSFTAETDDASFLSSALISYLNKEVGSRYKATEEITRRIGELLAAGYTSTDMRAVIDKKVAEWKDNPTMRSYLRPRTLFGDLFEEYADAPAPVEVEKEQKKAERIVKLREQRQTESESLSEIIGRMQIIRDAPGGIKADWENYRALSDQKAIREQNIEIIDQRLGRLTT